MVFDRFIRFDHFWNNDSVYDKNFMIALIQELMHGIP